MRAFRCRILSFFMLGVMVAVSTPASVSAANGVPGADAQRQPRLAVMDWTLLETLVALGRPPVAAADLRGYDTWVGGPALPDAIVDIGIRNQPSRELLSQLAPDQILMPPLFAALKPILSPIAPVQVLPLYAAEGPLWQSLRQFTRSVATHADDPVAADRLIGAVESRLALLAERLPANLPPLLIVQFLDDRHVRVFGDHSLYQAVLERLGLATAWRGLTNFWGFSVVGLEALADPANLASQEARMVVIEPLPPGLRAQMKRSGLWQSLPSVVRGDVLYLPPAWSFGGLPSAQRFAELLSKAMLE